MPGRSEALENLSEQYSRRLIFAYQAAALLVFCISLLWCAVFAANGWWELALADVVLALVSFASLLLIRARLLTAALVVSELAFLAFILGFCLMFDMPTANAPRVTHLYLPVLAMLGYINYLRRKSKFQLVVIAACLASFIFLSASSWALPFAHSIPDEIRFAGTWINSALATAMVCGCIYVIRLEFTRQKGMVRELQEAMRNDELELFLQQQINNAGDIIGAEALLRWKHPQRGYIAPNVFIPLAEESNLMPLLGGWVLKDACRTLAIWQEDPVLSKLTLAVNVSASQFAVKDFQQSVLDTVAFYGIDPARLKLELTESVIIAGMEPVIAKMNALRAAGIRFALDDFGTGYSSLSYLRRLPIYQLKVDRSFVNDSTENQHGAALVRSIVQMGRDLGLVVLAEGVETTAQHALLLDSGCHEFQGFHFGRPVPRETFEATVQAAAAQLQAGIPQSARS